MKQVGKRWLMIAIRFQNTLRPAAKSVKPNYCRQSQIGISPYTGYSGLIPVRRNVLVSKEREKWAPSTINSLWLSLEGSLSFWSITSHLSATLLLRIDGKSFLNFLRRKTAHAPLETKSMRSVPRLRKRSWSRTASLSCTTQMHVSPQQSPYRSRTGNGSRCLKM